MDEESKDYHRKFAIDCFNGTWDLIDKKTRTHDDDIKMIHTAHASRYHWGEIGSPLEFARGDWQLSRVYALLGDGTSAIKYAEESLNHCLENNIGDFDLAFAYEALARASLILRDETNFNKYFNLAKESAEAIEEEENQKYFLRELNSIK